LTQEDLLRILKFVECEAAIVIHFNFLGSIKQFVKNDYYRNLFEVGTGGGNTCKAKRKKWENYLFHNIYNLAYDYERIKYGAMNFLNNRKGIWQLAGHYGTSFLVLKESVRERCTMTHFRSYKEGEVVATLRYCAAVLNKFTRKELRVLS
jgi:hypothetical protein